MGPCCRWSWRGYVGIKCSGSSPAQSNRCARGAEAWCSMWCRCSLCRLCSRSICVQVETGYFRAGDSVYGLGFLQLSITSALLYAFTTVSFWTIPQHVVFHLGLSLHNPRFLSQSFRSVSLPLLLGPFSPRTVVPTHQLWCGCWGCGFCRLGFRQCRSSRCRGCSCCRRRARRGTAVGCHWRARGGCGARRRCRRRWPGTSAVWHWGCPLLDRAGTPPPSWSRLPSAGRRSQSTAW